MCVSLLFSEPYRGQIRSCHTDRASGAPPNTAETAMTTKRTSRDTSAKRRSRQGHCFNTSRGTSTDHLPHQHLLLDRQRHVRALSAAPAKLLLDDHLANTCRGSSSAAGLDAARTKRGCSCSVSQRLRTARRNRMPRSCPNCWACIRPALVESPALPASMRSGRQAAAAAPLDQAWPAQTGP